MLPTVRFVWVIWSNMHAYLDVSESSRLVHAYALCAVNVTHQHVAWPAGMLLCTINCYVWCTHVTKQNACALPEVPCPSLVLLYILADQKVERWTIYVLQRFFRKPEKIWTEAGFGKLDGRTEKKSQTCEYISCYTGPSSFVFACTNGQYFAQLFTSEHLTIAYGQYFAQLNWRLRPLPALENLQECYCRTTELTLVPPKKNRINTHKKSMAFL